jgi:hypothetical protein
VALSALLADDRGEFDCREHPARSVSRAIDSAAVKRTDCGMAL